MKNLRHWIWFTQAIGYCTPKAKNILEMYKSILPFYEGGEDEWRLSGLFSAGEIEKLRQTPLSAADGIIEACTDKFYYAITLESEDYPKCLYEIDDPPAVLYISGMLPDLDDRLSIALVGTRNATVYSVRSAYDFAFKLSKCGVTIISGGALGVDSSAHMGTLAAEGVTVCVLGCGIDYDYLRENARMRSDITFRGAVISEYPPGSEPYPFRFPQRNRIISALANGILVVEAGKRSGSLITVNRALEQSVDKKIFALAGPADPHFKGSNQLIKDGVASLVLDYKDIIDAFDNVYATEDIIRDDDTWDDAVNVIPVKGKAPENVNGLKANDLTEIATHKKDVSLTEEQKKIYYIIGNEPLHVDEIAERSDIPSFKIPSIMTVLEVKGLVESTQGRKYKLK